LGGGGGGGGGVPLIKDFQRKSFINLSAREVYVPPGRVVDDVTENGVSVCVILCHMIWLPYATRSTLQSVRTRNALHEVGAPSLKD